MTCLVLLPAPATDAGVLPRRLRALLADLPFAKDILVSDQETYAHARTQLNSVYRDIAEECLPLWRDGQLGPRRRRSGLPLNPLRCMDAHTATLLQRAADDKSTLQSGGLPDAPFGQQAQGAAGKTAQGTHP